MTRQTHDVLYDHFRGLGSGTASITSGTTSVTVAHGLDFTPTADQISVCPTNSPTSAPGWFWVDTITSTDFNINVTSDPSTSGADFAWRIDQ